jgi:ABC-2 type transport system ATP-binding protein
LQCINKLIHYMIKVTKVSFTYKSKKPVFNQLNVQFERGHIYGLLGKNGAGKSTLLRIATGLLRPTQGSAEVEGINSFLRSPALLQKLLYIPEEVYLPSLNFSQYEKVYGAFYPKFSAEQFRHYLQEFDVPANGKINECSYGQQKKIFMSFALACNMDYLLMDEPTNGMDIPSKKQFRKVMAGYLTSDRLVIISSHQVRDLENLMDTIVIIDNSRILLYDTVDSLQNRLYFTKTNVLPEKNLLYSEPVFGGHDVILLNEGQQHSALDTEKLFNAVLCEPAAFSQHFMQH